VEIRQEALELEAGGKEDLSSKGGYQGGFSISPSKIKGMSKTPIPLAVHKLFVE
jgi:hypothetical protein